MNKIRRIAVIAISFVLIGGGALFAEGLTANEIINKANLASYYAGKDGKSDVRMTITDSQGRERVREFRILRLNIKDGGDQKFYVYFTEPADVAKMVFMVWKHPGQDDDRWLYLPALDLVKRIAASDKRSSFIGSHFVYEDVSGRGTNEDDHQLVGSEGNLHKIKNTPKDSKGVEFAYYYVWIDKANFIPMKAEYYDGQGKLIRVVEALEVKDIEGIPTVTKSHAKNFLRGGETTIDFLGIDYNVGLDESVFAERYLRRAPAKWVQ
ncbi:MAG: outer membrane lipoprotein-sorting protein [Nitrospinae bacterium]|nr:outer membrane lipoprotein-sorting protein [Nitrospinota bacterium]